MMTPNVGGPLLQFHATGKVRILAINAETRLAAAPDIPTAIEAGLPGMIAANFNGLFAPAGVPKPVIDRLAQLTKAALAEKEVQDALIKSGFEPIANSGPEEGSADGGERAQALGADHQGDELQIMSGVTINRRDVFLREPCLAVGAAAHSRSHRQNFQSGRSSWWCHSPPAA